MRIMLYFIKSGDYCKVGFSRDAKAFFSRMRTYLTHNPSFQILDLHKGDISLVDLKNELESLLIQQIDVQSLIGGFRHLFTYVNGNIGFHRWGALKFFLMEYEKDLQDKGLSHVEWNNYYDVQIEHIMPRTWSTHWTKEMNDYLAARSSLNEEEVKQLSLNI